MEHDDGQQFDRELQSLDDMIIRVNGARQGGTDEGISILLTEPRRPRRPFLDSILRLFM